jgi:S1-C subfamily serine protease
MLDFRPGQARARKSRQRFDFAITGDNRTTLFVKAVLVVDVDPGSPAADYLTQGDVILSVNHHPVNSVVEFNNLAAEAKGQALLRIVHQGETLSLEPDGDE